MTSRDAPAHERAIKTLRKWGTRIDKAFLGGSVGKTEVLSADEVYCEVPFCHKSGSEIWHGIMDVVYRVGEQWFILDYKTNADANDLEVKYQEQLAAYVEAFHELTGYTAKPMIYHIDV